MFVLRETGMLGKAKKMKDRDEGAFEARDMPFPATGEIRHSEHQFLPFPLSESRTERVRCGSIGR